MKVCTKEIPISTDEPVTLIPISDVHVGNIGCDMEKFKATVQWIKDRGAYAILLGDMIDAIIPDDKRFENDSIDQDFVKHLDNLPYKQTTVVADILNPIKDNILATIGGNHEQTVKTKYSFDSAAVLADMLGIEQLTDPAFVKLRFRRSSTATISYDIFITHGISLGGGALLGGKVNNIMKLSNGFVADMFLAGHTHQLFTATDRCISPSRNGKLVSKNRIYINTGTFQRTYDIGDKDTWASRKVFMPSRTGVARVDFYLDKAGNGYKIDPRVRA